MAACPKRTVIASSKLIDPQNTAEPIPSHKHAIESKRAADSTNKQLGGAASGPTDSRPSGDQPSLPTDPSTVPSTEPDANANQSNPTIRKAGSNVEDDGESGDELIKRRK